MTRGTQETGLNLIFRVWRLGEGGLSVNLQAFATPADCADMTRCGGGIELVLVLMRTHATSDTVQAAGCMALRGLVTDAHDELDEDLRRDAVAQGTPDQVGNYVHQFIVECQGHSCRRGQVCMCVWAFVTQCKQW